MEAKDVLELLRLFHAAGIEVVVDGGWAVDTLLGEQTRPHEDLDIALRHRDVPKLRRLLEDRGYRDVPRDDTRDCNFVLGDPHGRLVDIHSYEFDEQGNNIYGVAYVPGDLTGTGTILGHPVRCGSVESLIRGRSGYQLRPKDFLDVRALCARFGLPLPALISDPGK